MKLQTKEILDIKIDLGLTYSSVSDLIDEHLSKFKHYNSIEPKIICTTNPEFIMKAQNDPLFKQVINNSYLSLPDGFGVLFGLELFDKISSAESKSLLSNLYLAVKTLIRTFTSGSKYGDVITGVDLIDTLSQLAEEKSYNVFLLGGWPKDLLGRDIKEPAFEVSSQAAQELKKKYPKLNVVGSTSKYSSSIEDENSTIEYILSCMKNSNVDHIDILLVAYSFGEQEKWLSRNMSKIPALVGIGVGGSFDYISNHIKRPPPIIRELHLEWFYRLITQPFRLLRIYTALISFPLTLCRSKVYEHKDRL